MKTITLSLILVLFVSACSKKSESTVTNIPQAKAAAQKAAEQWLALVDAGSYAESWKNASAFFQSAVTRDQWGPIVSGVRGPMGDLVSRQFKSARYSEMLPDSPDGNYVVLQFDTSFANKKDAVETVTPKFEPDGKWKVSGYYIK